MDVQKYLLKRNFPDFNIKQAIKEATFVPETKKLDVLFKEMQDNCEKTFEEKDLEDDENTGTKRVRGSREFINSLIKRGVSQNKKEEKKEQEDKQLDLFA